MVSSSISLPHVKPVAHNFEPYSDNGGSSLAIAGDDFCIVAADTRQSDGYLINSRNEPKSFKLTDHAVICVNGYHADGLQLTKDLSMNLRMYKYNHEKTMSIQSIAQLTSTILYSHRFFPYYTFTLLAGIDEAGRGAVYSFDPVGSFERESYRSGGSAASLIQPFLDCKIGQKNRTQPSPDAIKVDEAIQIAKDAFSSAAERDIYTGDFVQIWVLTKTGATVEVYPIRKD